MIPNEHEAKALWDKYQLPQAKRVHVTLVARVAVCLAKKLQYKHHNYRVNESLLSASALLHDIDKAILKLPGENHPDAGVRVLKEEGMSEVANVVKTHSLHSILDPDIMPKTWEEKLLYLADKMVKYDVIGVDRRFALWNAEHLPKDAQELLDRCYPKVKTMEKELFDLIEMDPQELPKILEGEACLQQFDSAQ